MTKQAKQTNPIHAAVEVYRAPALKRAEERAREFAASLYAKLEQNDWHLEAVAPSPRGTDSRRDYAQKKAVEASFLSITSYDHPRCELPENRYPNHKTFLQRDDAKLDRFVKSAIAAADAAFDGYVSKLVAKTDTMETPAVGPVVKAEVDNGSIWTYSILTVTRAGGDVERWKTQCIINVSVLGKLFNQWPTRLIK